MTSKTLRKRSSISNTELKTAEEVDHVLEVTAETKGDMKKMPIELVVDKSNEKIDFRHYIAMAVWLGWPSFYLLLMLTFPLLWLYARPLLITIIAVLTASAILPIDTRKQPKWAMDLGASIMKYAPAYFSLKIFCEDQEAVNKHSPALFAMEPHDILPVSIFSFSGILGYFPAHDCRGCLSSACFMLPGMRHVYTWGQAADVNKKTINRNLSKGRSLALCPGGAHEVCFMTDNSNKECVLYLKNRMGIVKMAALHGVAIIPTFTFNQRDAFSFWIPQWRWLHKLGRRIGFIPLMFAGIWGIPYAMPAPTPLNLVVGSPIVVPKMEAPISEDMLRPYHDQLIEAMERIFENNKAQFGMQKVVLKIV